MQKQTGLAPEWRLERSGLFQRFGRLLHGSGSEQPAHRDVVKRLLQFDRKNGDRHPVPFNGRLVRCDAGPDDLVRRYRSEDVSEQ